MGAEALIEEGDEVIHELDELVFGEPLLSAPQQRSAFVVVQGREPASVRRSHPLVCRECAPLFQTFECPSRVRACIVFLGAMALVLPPLCIADDFAANTLTQAALAVVAGMACVPPGTGPAMASLLARIASARPLPRARSLVRLEPSAAFAARALA